MSRSPPLSQTEFVFPKVNSFRPNRICRGWDWNPHGVAPKDFKESQPGSAHRDPPHIGNNGSVNDWKFVNQFQPQTLYIATILCYIDAVSGLLFGVIATSVLLALIVIIGLAAGGFGIANEKKWGYAVAVGGAVVQVIMLFAVFGSDVLTSSAIINLLFDGALVALLLHPMSRDYQRIWFK